MNVLHDGTHTVADTVLVKLRAHRETLCLWVAPGGMVTLASVRKSWRRTQPPPDEHLIGVYTPAVPCRDIRADLEAWVSEARP